MKQGSERRIIQSNRGTAPSVPATIEDKPVKVQGDDIRRRASKQESLAGSKSEVAPGSSPRHSKQIGKGEVQGNQGSEKKERPENEKSVKQKTDDKAVLKSADKAVEQRACEKVGDSSGQKSSSPRSRLQLRSPRQGSGGASSGVSVLEGHSFGIVVNVLDSFGFIQPFFKTEQVYFPLKETGGIAIVVGSEISYKEKVGPKGLSAERVRPVDPTTIVQVGKASGVVTREAEVHRDRPVPGQVQIDSFSGAFTLPITQDLKSVAVVVEDSASPRKGGGGGSTKRGSRGDEVEVTLLHIPGTTFLKAKNLKVTRNKRELAMAAQIDQMLAAGLTREQGIIETIKGEYGFIKPADRADQIYFKLDDIPAEKGKPEEGAEVSFFVVTEIVRQKMSDRAMHLEILPAGTVEFETTLAEKVVATVITEPVTHPEEEPGRVRLQSPLPRSARVEPATSSAAAVGPGPDITEVELWPRCLSESLAFMQFRVGDEVTIDVQHYRPEKLFFARSVEIQSLRKLGRELGIVCSVRDQLGFGFIKSFTRDSDLYFRTAEVLDGCNSAVAESDVRVNMVVSYDVISEDSMKGGGGGGGGGASGKLRAVRVKRERRAPTSVRKKQSYAAVSSGESTEVEEDYIEAYVVLKQGLRGIVARDIKRDSPGLIKVCAFPASDGHMTAGGREERWISDPAAIHELLNGDAYPPDLIEALEEFRGLAELRDISLENLSTGQRKVYHDVLDAKFPNICHESVDVAANDPSRGKLLRLWKIDSDSEYAAWRSERDSKKSPRERAQAASISAGGSVGESGLSSPNIFFAKKDVNDSIGPVGKDLEVVFDLCLDRKSNKRVAKGVTLTDEAVVGAEGHQIGILEAVSTGKNGKFGFLRKIPTDEKLFWNISDIRAGSELSSSLVEGREVHFTLRRRGGLRCAVDVTVLPAGELSREEELEGTCIGVVSSTGDASSSGASGAIKFVTLVDMTQCPLLRDKYWSTEKLRESLSESALSTKKEKEASKIDQFWEKKGSATAAPGYDSTSAAVAGASAGPTADAQSEPNTPSGVVNPIEASVASLTLSAVEAAVSPRDEGETSPTPNASRSTVGQPKFFGSLNRTPVAFSPPDAATDCDNASASLAVGDWVECRVVVNWALQRHPVKVLNAVKVPGLRPLTKLRGAITRLRVRHKGGGGGEGSINELCEIKLYNSGVGVAVGGGGAAATASESTYYCDIRDVSPHSDTSRESIQLGDAVEFFGVELDGEARLAGAVGLAVAVTVLPKAGADGINFKRGINLALKDPQGKKAGVNSISMAKGPDESGGGIGFKAGWRDLPVIQGLPWAHLLAHLQLNAAAVPFSPSATAAAPVATP